MKTFNPNKKIKIEIHSTNNSVDGYTIYDVSGNPINLKIITQDADESDIEDILGMHDFNAFETTGESVFMVDAEKLTDKFHGYDLIKDDGIIAFIELNVPPKMVHCFTYDDIKHIADCIESLDKYFKGEVPKLGSFLTCIAKRDFYNALHHADSVNMIALPIYAAWMYNHAPAPEFLTD